MSMAFGSPQPDPYRRNEHPLGEPLEQRRFQRRMEVRLKGRLLEKRVQLSLALWAGDPSEPEGRCPFCDYELSIQEILRGFSDDVLDTTTECPRCHTRFQPQMIARTTSSIFRVPFLCEAQTLHRMAALKDLEFGVIKENHPEILASARFYFGSLTAGFRRLNILFKGEPRPSWESRIIPFLGMCPDTLIAETCNVSKRAVQRLRQEHGIPAYKGDDRCLN